MSSINAWKLLQKDSLKVTSSNIKRLYFKNGLLAICKPYGIPVHSGPKVKQSVKDMFPGLEKKYELPAGSLELANRLDKNVSGVLLLTYKKEMAAYIAYLQRERRIEKSYYAILVGNTTKLSGTLRSNMVENNVGKQYKQMIQLDKATQLQAVTDYQVLDNSMKTCMLCEFKTKTGYKHQLRVHASQILGYPILGDHKYHLGVKGPQPLPLRMMQLLRMQGVKTDLGEKGKIRPWQRGLVPLHLFAQKVIIPGLDNKTNVDITAGLPSYFRETLKNCDLLFNRSAVEEMHIDRKRTTPRELRDSIFVPKGVSPARIGQETAL